MRMNLATLGLLAVLLFAPAVRAEDPREFVTRSDVVLRSLVIPGWGQIHARHELRGVVWLAGEGLLLGGAVSFWLAADAAQSAYLDASPTTPGPCAGTTGASFSNCVVGLRTTAGERGDLARNLLALAVVAHVANLVDAALLDLPRRNAPLALQLVPTLNGALLAGSF